MSLEVFAPKWIEEYARANRQKPRGIQSKQSILDTHLLPRFGARPLNRFTDVDVQQLKAALADRAPKTVNNVLSVLNKLLKTAVRWKLLPVMPVTVDLLQVPPPSFSFYEFDEFALLSKEATRMDERLAVMVLLGGEAGLRMGEMSALGWDDVDFRREQICVARSESQGEMTVPKGGRSRVVPLTKALVTALAKLCAGRRDKQARVLTRDDGSGLSEQTLRTWISNVQKAAGLRVTGALHVLRHTFCSHLAMRGAPVLAIKELAGHRSLRTTMRYMHLSNSEARRAIALLDLQGARQESVPPAPPLVSPTGFEPVGGQASSQCSGNRRKQDRRGAGESRRGRAKAAKRGAE